MDRETKEIKIGSHVIVIKTYITGREARDIESVLIDTMEVSQTGISGLKGSQLKDKQDMQIKSVVVSFDGKTENVVDNILDLPKKDYDKVMELVKEITDPKEEKANN